MRLIASLLFLVVLTSRLSDASRINNQDRGSNGFSVEFDLTDPSDCSYLLISTSDDASPVFTFGYQANTSKTQSTLGYKFLVRPQVLMFLNSTGALIGSVDFRADGWSWTFELIDQSSFLFFASDSNSPTSFSLLLTPFNLGALFSLSPTFYSLTIPPTTSNLTLGSYFYWCPPQANNNTVCSPSALIYPGNGVYLLPNSDAPEGIAIAETQASFSAGGTVLNTSSTTTNSVQASASFSQGLYNVVLQPADPAFLTPERLSFPTTHFLLEPPLHGKTFTCSHGHINVGGFSTGEIVGIAIGSVAAFVVLLLLIFFTYRHFQHRSGPKSYQSLD